MLHLHNLLKRQLRKYFGDINTIPNGWMQFLELVNNSYWEFDNDRNMLERALELSSQELLEANSEMRAVLQAFPDVIIRFSLDGTLIDYKAGSSTDLSVKPEKIIGKHINDIYPDRMGASILENIARANAEQSIVNKEYSIRSGGELAFYEARFLPLYKDQVIVIVRNITERKIIEEQLRFLSMHDSLTGLYNRAYFKKEMVKLNGDNFKSVGLIICDIDGLKLINDTLGHNEGDKILADTAKLLRNCFDEKHIIGRIGGDEFAVLLIETNKYSLEEKCNSIREAIEQHNRYETGIPLSISIGFAVKNEDIKCMEDVFKEADHNMYREKLHHRQSTHSSIVQTLMKALEERDFITQGHANRLQGLVGMLALSLGLPKHKIADLDLLAQFHDIGKVGIPDRILFKQGRLSTLEMAEMARHSEIGYRIAQSSADLLPIANWILHHHECWNGSGYPMGLKEEEIPLECRILALADSYDAMTNDRPYRPAMTHEQAVTELKNNAGTQFDPVLAEKFVLLLDLVHKFDEVSGK